MLKLSEYLPNMKLDGYSFELCQERVDKWEKQSVTKLSEAFIILKSELLIISVQRCG